MPVDVGTPLALTTLGAVGTAVGGALATLPRAPAWEQLGLVQSVAAGMMLGISFLDLMPEAMEQIGFLQANGCFFLGVFFFAMVAKWVPEPDATWISSPQKYPYGKKDTENSNHRPVSKPMTGKRKSGKSHHLEGMSDKAEQIEDEERNRQKVLLSGFITALGIALHNFPEGIAVFIASLKSTSVGLSLAVAIALHNVPEGVAVAMPVYFATNSRRKAFTLALLSGLAEPLAVLVLGLLVPIQLSPDDVERTIAGVAGIMSFLAFHELLPLAFFHAGKERTTWGLIVGMAIMSMSLYWLSNF